MDFLADKYLISSLLAISVGLAMYVFLVPRSVGKYQMGLPGETPTGMMKAMSFFSSELHAALPAEVAEKLVGNPNKELESLIQRSGNPWRIKAQDFKILQITGLVVGIIIGYIVSFLMTNYGFFGVPWWAGVGLGGFFGH